MTTVNKDFKVKHGLSVGGDIDLSGTVDGRDLAADGTKLDNIESGATADQTKSDIDALGINATQVSGFTVGKSVPSNALFTDTDTVYSHPANHAISVITGLQSALDGKIDDGQVLTDVPSGALFTDTNTTYSVGDGGLTTNDFTNADHSKLNGIDTAANNYNHPTNHAISVITGLQTALDGKVDDSQVLTNVPSGALFTDTTYSVGDGGLTTNDFTNADHSKLNAIAASANNYTHPANHAISVTTGLQDALDLKAPLASPALSGAPTAPTAAANTNTTQVATTAYVQTELTDLIGGAPGTLDTLNELAAAINDDASYASTLTTDLSTKVNKTSNQALSTAANAMTISGHTITLNRGDGTTDAVTVPDNNTTYSVGDGGLTTHNFTTADHNKLNAIEASATADQSASEILTKIKTVDGTGSGLDADLLDGQQGSYYSVSHSHPYLPTTAPTKLTNINTLSNESKIIPWHASTVGRPAASQSNEYGAGIQLAYDGSFASQIAHDFDQDNLYYRKLTLGTDSGTWSKVWSSTNDGSGSGLDADTLDGYNAEEGVVNNSIVKRDGAGAIKVGNILLDKDNAEINLKSGIAGTSGAINWTYNTTGTNYASIKLPYDTRASTGLHIDSGYPITIDSSSSTGIKFLAGGAQRAVINSSGLNVTGNITLSGTVDGRDVAADGTKLNTIETSATADQSASEILTKIKTVDVNGTSGINAGTIDGIPSDRITYGNNASGTNEGNVSDWNSPTKSGFYSHSGASNRWSGASNWSSILHHKLYTSNNSYASQLGFDTYSNNVYHRTNNNGTWTSWDKSWTDGNDGSGSGLDADTLDGQQGSYYSPTSHQHDSRYVRLSGSTMTGPLTTPAGFVVGTDVGSALLQVQGAQSGDWAGRFENTHASGFGALVITAGTTSTQKAFEVRTGTSNTALIIKGDGHVNVDSGYLNVSNGGGGQISLGDWSNGNPIGISEGLWNTVGSDADYLTVYSRSSFNIRGYSGGTTHWLALTASTLNLSSHSLQMGGTTVIDSSRNLTNINKVGIGLASPIAKLQTGSHTFTGANGVYNDSRLGSMVNGNLTSMVYASTYNNASYPDYGLVFIHGPSTSSYNVWAVTPDGPAKGDSLNFIYGAQATNIHTTVPKVVFDGNGNVGIGTGNTAPAARLHVSGPTSPSTYTHSGVDEYITRMQTSYDGAGSQNLNFVNHNGNWLDGSSGADSSFGLLWAYQSSQRAGIVYDHRSSEKFDIFSGHGEIRFRTTNSATGNMSPIGSESTMPARLTIAVGGVVTGVTGLRAPIFYDSDNTAYYTNPADVSNVNKIQSQQITRTNSRINSGQKYPVGHYSTGETVWEIDPTWNGTELAAYFNAPTANVYWTADSTAPGGYAIYINGGVSVGGVYGSGFPYIPVETDDEFYMECWIKNVGTSQTHYMGSNEYNENFGNLGGNPGSYGYWVMSNNNPGSAWVKRSAYITGFGNSVGQFETGTKYWTPLALLNYGAGSGTRACMISGWKITRVTKRGNQKVLGTISSTPQGTLWGSSNDGSGSGLDADTVRGHAPVLIYNSAGSLLN